ncbi:MULTISPECIES: hypothetical protein [unclassified Bradyrhizobium]|uniref:hypothetical protein n=1 Tax=unclassified Bradyrhizobium TaxID=2631580 RepID=UPI001BA7F639|nr:MULTISPECIES: hypothetical protein [unclassified Bradyrhizobium]MBR1225352.1 hypothetical protein [Bradyrhizobium sp. AUGA SZCCT0176]MBR1271283.1 hypothetical protein [Bradyrhizobium sp. AUGA SZCCT0222]MBR1283985.1 hypothetical protein [Bradyrhizobium sp. AUGA SZCCT0177]MBR1299984.1 hypothetical protein [Bradyrhizobium sp. AUGA SZCCT0042]
MSVVAFERTQETGIWSERELNTICAALQAALAPSTGREWETGTTEKGDAQFYLLGPLPDQACELCVSRIGARYILEDGSGRLLFEHRNLDIVALHARAAVPSTSWLMVKAITLWCAIRSAFHEKLEPMIAETEELLVQLAPQLAAFA